MVYFLPIVAAVDGEGALEFLLKLNLYLNLVPCVLSALALFVAARNWGIRRPWLALIPVADLWVLGKITDTYHLHVRGRKKYTRRILPALGLGALLSIVLVSALAYVIPAAMFVLEIALMFGTVGLWAVFLIQRYIALCDLYRAGTSGKENWYMVLSVFFPFLIPFFIFSSR